ncbi:CLUMA_CG010820, isoform A [Clunio marinus]|uniref:CLUMA_CG010820, isoform A n=1 Tax=Clunio marinus TaxID=568069 RepID=A0A1J1IAX0_9DIPT|nr:CLUMA_CG010820, isoform A [Clunio marinus]
MKNIEQMLIFLEKYLQSKSISWLELFIFEYNKNKKDGQNLMPIIQGSDKFLALSFQMSYHLLKLLFSTICNLMTSNDCQRDKNAVLNLRNFLTCGLGSQIITILSADLDLSNVTNEHELVNVLAKIFPNERWDESSDVQYLNPLSRDEVKQIYKQLWLLNPSRINENLRPKTIVKFFSNNESTYECNIPDDIEDYLSSEFKDKEMPIISSSQLAQHIIKIFQKLVIIDNTNTLKQTDKNSVTMRCLQFSLDTLNHLHEQKVFNDVDQNVIKLNLLKLTMMCLNNLINRDGKSIEPIFKKLFSLLELSDSNELSCGFILSIMTILNNLCVTKSIQKTENLNLFVLCNHLITKRIELMSHDKELLDTIQIFLIRIVSNVRAAHQARFGENKTRKKPTIKHCHHDLLADACMFEKLLLETFPLIKSFKNFNKILKLLRKKGICCCNATIDTIKMFMQPSLIPMQYLSFIEWKIIEPMFNEDQICVFCNEKKNIQYFKDEYFSLLRKEISRREGWELHSLLHHLVNIQKKMNKDFLQKFIFNVIVPTFEEEKRKYLRNPDEQFESKVIIGSCLRIINEGVKEEKILMQFFNADVIHHLKECTLIPVLSGTACQLLKIAFENIKFLGVNEGHREKISQSINNIFFSNVLYLIREMMDIYGRIDLPKDIPLSDSITESDKTSDKSANDAADFEILDERTVAIKEPLTNLDVLLLNTIHWNILCDLMSKDSSFQREFIANIYNNFNGNILFTIAYNALNSILLKKELKKLIFAPEPKTINEEELHVLFKRCNSLIPVMVQCYDVNYQHVIERSYQLHEISESFLEKMKRRARDDDNHCLIFRRRCGSDNDFKFRVYVHKDVFLTDNVIENSLKHEQISVVDDHFNNFYHSWLNTRWTEIFHRKAIRSRFLDILNKFVKSEEEKELEAIYRKNIIEEITGKCGIKYLSSIARNCFDICWRLSDNISFSAKMSTALEELKLLLLQDSWDVNKEAMIDTLQLLLGVAEMKMTRSVSRMMLMDPENHLNCSTESMFSDSSLDRITFDEKSNDDDESYSSDKKTETFYTADENYDADEEVQSTVDTECSQFNRSTSSPAPSKFRNTNEHICKLVVEILMELSRRCVEKPSQWDPNVLTSLAQRLSCMKTYLGGSEILLKGFSGILLSRNESLSDLQKTILNLVEDLNAPEAFKTFLSILTENEACVELIVSRLVSICNKEKSPQPFIKVSFPTFNREVKISSTCDDHIRELIQKFRDAHVINNLLTPFTESSQIIPLNFLDFNPWSFQGFTISIWMMMETLDGDKVSSHLFSIGTEKLMLSVYLNADGSFNLNVTKPNQKFSDVKVVNRGSNKENINKTNLFGIGLATLKSPENHPNIRTRGHKRNGFKKATTDEGESSRRLQTLKVSMKSKKMKLKSDQWTHICFSIRTTQTNIMLLITMNGTEQDLVEIPIDGMCELELSGMLELLCIGAQKSTIDEESSLKYSLSNVILFRSLLDSPSQTSHLFSLGPACENLIDCEAVQMLPLMGFLDMTKVANKSVKKIERNQSLIKLKMNVLMIYSAGKTTTPLSYKNHEHGKPIDIFNVGEIPKPFSIPSLARSIHLSGGLSSLLFLFARTVEMTDDPVTQSSALYVFLKMSYSCNNLYVEFEQRKLFNLVAHVFKHSNCNKGGGMLKAILDVIYGGTMFYKNLNSEDYRINEKSVLNIQNPKLLLKLLENFSIFQTMEKSEVNVLDLLFQSLMVVVRDNHPHKYLNRQYLLEHDFYMKIIQFCKIHLTIPANTIPITPETALIIVRLLKMLSKTPTSFRCMKEIQKLLLLMHHPSESFVTHDRTKFHFILPGSKPQKQNKLNTSSGSKYFNFSIKIRSTNATTSISKSPTTPTSSFHYEWRDKRTSSTNRKIKTRKFDELTESECENVTKALIDQKMKRDVKTPTIKQRRHVRRLNYTPKKSPFKKLPQTTMNQKKNKMESCDDDQALTDAIRSMMTAESTTSLLSDASDVNRYEKGVRILQENLFMMLRDSVILLEDSRAVMELSECLQIEMLIMFANHHDANVRAAIIELIIAMMRRETSENILRYEKGNYWIHLGNQLTISRVNMRMVQACVDWICSKKVSIQDLSRSQAIEIHYKPIFNVLFMMIPSMIHDAQLMNYLIKFLRLILETQSECFNTTMFYCLISSSLKALNKLDQSHYRVKESLLLLFEQIASKSLTSTGSIQTLWDLLYGFSYLERNKKHEVVREVHVTILRQLLSLCLVEQNRRGSRSINDTTTQQSMFVVTQTLGNLPSSEIKTRFLLIHDRAVQFVCSWNLNEEKLSIIELDFVKYLIQLNLCGFQHGSSMLLWGLSSSNDEEVQSFIIQKLSSILSYDGNFSLPGNETKLVKALLVQHLNKYENSLDERNFQSIIKFCGGTINQQQQSWNWSLSAEEKIELIRQTSEKNQNEKIEKIVYKLETLVQSCIDGAMKMTRYVIDIQNSERRELMNELKTTQEIDFYREWFELIQRMIHEDAPWFNASLYPSTWELDETEGPGRSRIRFKRNALKIEERFFTSGFKHKASYQHVKPLLDFIIRPKEVEKYSIRDRIVFTFNGKHLTMEQEIRGEIIITDNQLIFLANLDIYINSIICDIKNISEVWNRRYQHKEVALEIFLTSKKTFFIIFETNYERDIVKKFVSDKIDQKINEKPDDIAQKWIENRITNYEYLIELNKIAGRSYNDLMQYPVFPWIIADYESEVLNLKSSNSFRKLNKTISTQHEEMEEHYVTTYQYLAEQSLNDRQSLMKPYHYSSHYSNSGTILHFLVRLPPFTNMFLLYQDHNFDIPDRTFHSLATTYRLTSKESATDVKELIPEFFYLFDFFENSEGFNFGKRQSGDVVDDVKLPSWCEGSARLFMLINRQALECDYVRKQLHQWIDLIFGFKQKGSAAVYAVNVFHPATYPEFQITNINDPVERTACETMVRTYGQMPKQIFTTVHKKPIVSSYSLPDSRVVLSQVVGLRWGCFTGSPQLPKPKRIEAVKCNSKIVRLVSVEGSNLFYGLPDRCHLMQAPHFAYHDLVLWSESDGVVRMKRLDDSSMKSGKLFHNPSHDPITACGSHVKYTNLWFGHQSGNISVYIRNDEKITKERKRHTRSFNDALEAIIGIKEINVNNTLEDNEVEIESWWNYPIYLVKHRSEVLDIKVCVNFKIVVSICMDGTTVIWDSQKIEYIRTIESSCNTLRSQLSLVEISSTLGDILTIFTPKSVTEITSDEENVEVVENFGGDEFVNVSMAIEGKSQLRLHSINAKYISHKFSDGFATAVCFSFIKEGTGVNVIAVGFEDSVIRLYSTWTLEMIREIATGRNSRITDVVYTSNHHLAFLSDHEIEVWESDGLTGDPPKFNSIVLY